MRVSPVMAAILAVSVSGALPALAPPEAAATLYECRDAGGDTIFTDSPAQLSGCTPLKSAASKGSASSTTRTTPQRGTDLRRPPRPAQDPRRARQPRPRIPPQVQRSPTLDARAGLAPPATTGRPSQDKPSTSCTSPVNPLNPMLASPCPPADKAQ